MEFKVCKINTLKFLKIFAIIIIEKVIKENHLPYPCSLMDKATGYEPEECGFESY